MGVSKNKHQVLVYLPKKLHKNLKIKAAKNDKSVSDLVAESLSMKETVLGQDEIRRAVHRMVSKCEQKPLKVILFGSYSRDKARPASDVDLMVIVDKCPQTLAGLSQMSESFRRTLGLDRTPVDLFLSDKSEWDEWKDEFGSVFYDAEHEGIVLHGN